jgi:hypothetical protein
VARFCESKTSAALNCPLELLVGRSRYAETKYRLTRRYTIVKLKKLGDQQARKIIFQIMDYPTQKSSFFKNFISYNILKYRQIRYFQLARSVPKSHPSFFV